MGLVEEIFDPIHLVGLKKSNSTQLITGVNPTQPTWITLGWVGLNSWVGQFFYLLLLLLN